MVPPPVQVVLVEIGEGFDPPVSAVGPAAAASIHSEVKADGEAALGIVVVMHRERQLLEVILAGCAVGGLAHLLDGWQQQAHEHRNHGDHNQQLDQGESAPALPADLYLNSGHRRDPLWPNQESHFSAIPIDSGSGGAFQIFTVPSRLAEAIH